MSCHDCLNKEIDIDFKNDEIERLTAEVEQERKNCAALDRHYESYMKERVLIIAERDGLKDELYSWIEENQRLRELLTEAADEIEHWGSYASDYFQEKHGLDADIAKYRKEGEGE